MKKYFKTYQIYYANFVWCSSKLKTSNKRYYSFVAIPKRYDFERKIHVHLYINTLLKVCFAIEDIFCVVWYFKSGSGIKLLNVKVPLTTKCSNSVVEL